MKYNLTTLITIILTVVTIQAQNWPQWRGPEGNSIAAPGNYPVKFSATEGVLWKAELPGKGASTPIVWKDRIVLTSAVGEDDEGEDGVLCFDWQGKKLWQVKLGPQSPGKHPRGSGSNPSIVTDGQRLFAYFKSGTLAALDFNGKILWKTNLQESYGKIVMFWDLGSSPVLVNNNVVVAVMHENESYLLALEKTSGKVAWKTDRTFTCKKETAQSYSTPHVITDGSRTTIVVWGADHLTGHDAVTGETIWTCGGFNPAQKSYWRTIASAAISSDIAIVPYGREKYTAGIKIGGKGNITDTARLWEKNGIGTDVATPVISDGRVYIVNFKGEIWCLDIRTGKEIWQDELPKGKGAFYSSPIIAGKKLYLCREKGTVYVCEITSKGLKVLNQGQFDDFFVAAPVLVRDKIILRGEKNLYCIGR